MIVAGIGCRRNCPAAAIVDLVREAGGADMLAAPWFKRDERGLFAAARTLGIPLRFVPPSDLPFGPPQRGERPPVAEACALAGGGTLLRPRIHNALATCALAKHASCVVA